MNLFPLSQLESDICLLEDIISDLGDAWTLTRDIPVTPRTLDRLRSVLVRAHEVDVQLRALRAGMHSLVVSVEQERRRAS